MLVYDSKCKKCGAPVRLARMLDGVVVPLGARPSSRGTVVLERHGQRDVAVRAEARHGNQPRYAPHAIECPNMSGERNLS